MLTKDGREIRNAIEEAVYLVLNGPTLAAIEMRCAAGNFYFLMKRGIVERRATALALEEATEKAGCKVPAAELMALVPWQGPSRHPGLRHTAAPAAVTAISQARTNTRQTAAATAQVRETVRRGAKRGRVMPSRCPHDAIVRVTPVTPAAEAA